MGGIGTLLCVILGAILLLVLVVGYILAFVVGRKDPDGLPMKIWGHITLGIGFLTALFGSTGACLGLMNIHKCVSAAALGDPAGKAEAAALMAQGMFEVSFNTLFGFFFAFLALFGFLSVRLISRK
jgi:hypothetical protein